MYPLIGIDLTLQMPADGWVFKTGMERKPWSLMQNG